MTDIPSRSDTLSGVLREKAIDIPGRRILITRLAGTAQETDLSVPPNCGGYGRIRHFRRYSSGLWPENPLPIDPACKALGHGSIDIMRVQAFQNAVCNWRCWYCFVDFSSLIADTKKSAWFTTDQLIAMSRNETDPPHVIDLTGGQPDLTPEWIPWTMRSLDKAGLRDQVYLWSDDNLSTDYYWTHLSDEDRRLIRSWKMYGRVGCFKGIDGKSFSFNTNSEEDGFERQLSLYSRMLTSGVDLYAYVILTTPDGNDIPQRVNEFIDRLQHIHPNLPLRTVPLEVILFTPAAGRIDERKRRAHELQYEVVKGWQDELTRRYSPEQRARRICDVDLCSGAGRA